MKRSTRSTPAVGGTAPRWRWPRLWTGGLRRCRDDTTSDAKQHRTDLWGTPASSNTRLTRHTGPDGATLWLGNAVLQRRVAVLQLEPQLERTSTPVTTTTRSSTSTSACSSTGRLDPSWNIYDGWDNTPATCSRGRLNGIFKPTRTTGCRRGGQHPQRCSALCRPSPHPNVVPIRRLPEWAPGPRR